MTTAPMRWLVVWTFVVAGCGGGVRSYHTTPVPYSARVELQAADLTVEQEQWLGELCPSGKPTLSQFYAREPITVIVREGYAIGHNDRTKTPIWVCERIRHEDVHGGLTGRDSWAPDPILCSLASRCDRGAIDADYRNSGYDRGHLAPNMNQRRDAARKRETFYFSNAAPQVGRRFNSTVWQRLESDITTWTADLPELWTITGVLYYDEREEDVRTARGYVNVETIGRGSVFVPTHFYKIVVWRAAEGLQAFAVVMENRDYGSAESYRDQHNIKPIRWLEERLGVDFMPNLSPAEADRVETSKGRPFR